MVKKECYRRNSTELPVYLGQWTHSIKGKNEIEIVLQKPEMWRVTFAARNIFYKGHVKNETSLSLSKIRHCHCCIYDVIASLLLNKASKI